MPDEHRYKDVYWLVEAMAGLSVGVSVSQFSGNDRDCITKHLNELLDSKAFSGSRRSKIFLRYVVEEALAGRGSEIKERNIAIDLFSRGSEFDPQSDSIVRVSATEVRKRLGCAYKAGLGQVVHIELPIGSYQPAFHFKSFPASTPGDSIMAQSAAVNAVAKNRWKYIAALVTIGIAGVVVMAVLPNHNSSLRTSSLDLLWRPFCNQSSPVLISLPAPTVLQLRHPENRLLLEMQPEIPASEVKWRSNYFVGTGAALGAARFAEQLALRHQAFFIKFGTDVTFSDLNRSAAILLGSFSSPLTLEITKRLRFRFQTDNERHCIVDSMQSSRRWCVQKQEATESAEGYALVCRLLNSDSGHPIFVVAGIGARDTQAAVEFLSNPSYFDLFSKSAPRGWSYRHFEVVLHNSVHGDVPGAPAVVSSYVRR